MKLLSRRSPRNEPGRGQTTIDFAVGISIFLLTVAFVLTTVPGMLEPFAHDQDDPLVADRVASQLAEGHLGNPETPTLLNESCTFTFFEATGTACGFDAANPVSEQLHLGTRHSINVTLRRTVSGGGDPEVLCINGGEVEICGGVGTRMSRGPAPPATTGSEISARRTVFIDGKDTLLVVKIW